MRAGPSQALRPTWDSAGSVIVPTWPCTGWGLPGRRVTAPPVRSYRTFSPLPPTSSREARRVGGLFLWHFPAGFPGSDFPTTLPCGVRTFLERRLSLRRPRLPGRQPLSLGQLRATVHTVSATGGAAHAPPADGTLRRPVGV